MANSQDLTGIPQAVLDELPQILANLIAADNQIRQESVFVFVLFSGLVLIGGEQCRKSC